MTKLQKKFFLNISLHSVLEIMLKMEFLFFLNFQKLIQNEKLGFLISKMRRLVDNC
jgi:hypothetical protein